ncbi:MAG: hypothetical protein EPO23_03385 [Xanthobacteraceae bacterium]|nr:MAG: hypothetical protein EPO23_03385 [Xanthobacteraceae bacterium]
MTVTSPAAAETETVLGEVDRVVMILGRRTVVTDPDLIRVRDRDASGRLLDDIGYSPARALAMGQLLVRLALERDPSLRGGAVVLGDKEGA